MCISTHKGFYIFIILLLILFYIASSRDPIARKLRLRRSKRDHEEEKQAKILKVLFF
jgi:hypothetical protein